MSPPTVAHLTWQIQQLLKEWIEGPTPEEDEPDEGEAE
jgi:hypothetical protein